LPFLFYHLQALQYFYNLKTTTNHEVFYRYSQS
jgi:hypothetical protein